MLRAVSLAQQWKRIQAGLPPDWSDARLALRISDPSRVEQAAALLGPLEPGRARDGLRFDAARRGAGPAPAAIERVLARLDAEGIPGELHIVHALSDTKPVGTQGPVWYVGGKAV